MDYLEAAINPNFLAKKQYPEATLNYCQNAISGLVAGYFYFQGSLFLNNYKICEKNYKLFK